MTVECRYYSHLCSDESFFMRKGGIKSNLEGYCGFQDTNIRKWARQFDSDSSSKTILCKKGDCLPFSRLLTYRCMDLIECKMLESVSSVPLQVLPCFRWYCWRYRPMWSCVSAADTGLCAAMFQLLIPVRVYFSWWYQSVCCCISAGDTG